MGKGLSLTYRDAIRLLAADEAALHRLDELLGLGLLVAAPFAHAAVLPLFEVKGELLGRLTDLTADLRARVLKASDFDREHLLISAHAVIVMAAFIEELSRRLETIDADGAWRKEVRGLDVSSLSDSPSGGGEVKRTSRLRNVVEWGRHSLIEPPTPTRPIEKVTDDVHHLYQELARQALSYVRGLARWDDLDETKRGQISDGLIRSLPDSAAHRYWSNYLRLAAEAPEFLAWITINDHQATRQLIRQVQAIHDERFQHLERRLARIELGMQDDSTALAAIPRILSDLRDSGARLPQRPQSEPPSNLKRYHSLQQLALEKPLLKPELTEGVPGLVLPKVIDGYVSPRFRIADIEASSDGILLAQESWWHELSADQAPIRAVRTGIAAHIVAHLTTPRATSVPLLMLGHPGSGKSLFSKVLAAQLPPERYAVVTVELRHVNPTVTVAEQVEASLRANSNGKYGWRQLSEEVDRLTTVVVFDGLDELLQLSSQEGLGRYLERVQDFQEKEAALDHPTAAIVTARTLIMDRVFVPPNSVVFKLEDFADSQIEEWLSVWNRVNKRYFAGKKLRPCSPEVVTPHRHLAGQPLLLMMLALYDADDNALHTAGRLTQVALYERLFRKFAYREVVKWPTAATRPDEIEAQIEGRLRELSAIALGLFNRGRKFITREEVESDLSALGLQQRHGADPSKAVTPDIALSQFFFLYEAEVGDSKENLRHGYEFLHATFGEFLVARALTRALAEVGTFGDHSLASESATMSEMITSRLSPYLAHRPIVAEKQLLKFIMEMCHPKLKRTQLAASALSDALKELLFELRRTSDYRPRATSNLAATAVWSLNLLLITLIAKRGDVELTSELFDSEPLDGWRKLVRFWRSQLEPDDWDAAIQSLTVATSNAATKPIILGFDMNREDISVAAAEQPARAYAVRLLLEARLTSDRILEAFATFWIGVVGHMPAHMAAEDTERIARALSFAVGSEIDPEQLLRRYQEYLKLQNLDTDY